MGPGLSLLERGRKEREEKETKLNYLILSQVAHIARDPGVSAECRCHIGHCLDEFGLVVVRIGRLVWRSGRADNRALRVLQVHLTMSVLAFGLSRFVS